MRRMALRRQMTAVLFAAVLAGIAAIAEAPPAQAHDHRIPSTVLKEGAQDLQEGLRVVESIWNYLVGGGQCTTKQALYVFRFPTVDRVAAGRRLRVRIFKGQRPDAYSVTAYRDVDEDNVPVGEGQALRRSLEPVVRGGTTVAWDARFSVGRPARHYYLVTQGHWRDRQGCRGDQYAFWSFHVKTGR